MHELAVTEGMLNLAISEATRHNSKKILSIKLKLGEYSDIVPEIVQEFFDIVSRDTIAEGAKLMVERIPVTVECLDCGITSTLERSQFACPHCGSVAIKMLTGKEFFIESLEAE